MGVDLSKINVGDIVVVSYGGDLMNEAIIRTTAQTVTTESGIKYTRKYGVRHGEDDKSSRIIGIGECDD